MVESHRLFLCKACRRQVRICTLCDRGNVYCSKLCASSARSRTLRRAGKRYQQTHLGRRNHAARQKRYRLRQMQKVTHQGPHKEWIKVRTWAYTATIKQPAVQKEVPHEHNVQSKYSNNLGQATASQNAKTMCHFCLRPCGDLSRLGPLRQFRARPGRLRQARQPKVRVAYR